MSRGLLVVFIVAVAPGCRKWFPAEQQLRAWDVLTAYSKNSVDADARYKGKRLTMNVPHVKVSRDGADTVATYTPPQVSPQRYARFLFAGEPGIKSDTVYTITGRCDGLEGEVVFFRECEATEWRPLEK